jgi:cytoskeleton protein RodZ
MAQDSTQNRSNISEATEIDTGQSLGSYLQRERLKKQITLEEIAEQTRINLTTLQAIESNDRSKMPAEVFSKGFIKIYAKLLGLDVQDVLERYDREMALTDEDSIRNHDVFYNEKMAESSAFSPGKVFLFLLLLGLIALGSYFFFSSESPQPRRSTLVFPPENTPAATPAMQKENAPRPSPAEQKSLQWPAGNGSGAAIEPFSETPPAAGVSGNRQESALPQSGDTQPQPPATPPLTGAPAGATAGSSAIAEQTGPSSSP